MKDVLFLEQAIAATLVYFDLFDFPLTLNELAHYLYGWNASEEVIEKAAGEMPQISQENGFYFLAGRDGMVALRAQRAKIAEKLWKKTERFSWIFALCPFVKMVAVVNSMAFGNVNEKSDVDLFIVTKKNKLGCTRFFMKILTQIFAVRAHHEKIAGRFCLSFFVSEDAVNLEQFAGKFDPHLAYFTLGLTPLFGKETYGNFLKANDGWTSKYFKRPIRPRLNKLKRHIVAGALRFILEKILFVCGHPLESFLYNWQIRRDLIRKKALDSTDGVVMNKSIFKFHEKDLRVQIAADFQSKLAAIQGLRFKI